MGSRVELNRESENAIRIFGNVDRYVFGYFAHIGGLGVTFANQPIAELPWPKYKSLTIPLRHAIYIQPIVNDLQRQQLEQIDHETGQKLAEAFTAELAKLDAETAAESAPEAIQ
jgi:hypothetical protein